MGSGEPFAEGLEFGADAAVPDVAAHLDAKATDEIGIDEKVEREVVAVFLLQIAAELISALKCKFRHAFDGRGALLDFEADEALEGGQNGLIISGLRFADALNDPLCARVVHPAIHIKARAEKLPCGAESVFADFHERGS